MLYLLLLSSRLLLLLGDRVQVDCQDVLDSLVGHRLLGDDLGAVDRERRQQDDSLGGDENGPLELGDDVLLLLN